MRSLLGFAFASLLFGCAHSSPPPQPPPQPVSQTRTTGARLDQPSYGTSDINGWEAPSGTGNATHGPAASGATPRPIHPGP